MGRWCVSLTNLLMQSYNISLRAQKFRMFFATHFKHIPKTSSTHSKHIKKTYPREKLMMTGSHRLLIGISSDKSYGYTQPL